MRVAATAATTTLPTPTTANATHDGTSADPRLYT